MRPLTRRAWARWRTALLNGLIEGAAANVEQYREKVNRPYYPSKKASRPGEYPKRRTGQGRDSYTYELNAERLMVTMRYSETEPGARSPHTRPGGMHMVELIAMERLGPQNFWATQAAQNRFRAAFRRGVKARMNG